MDEFNDVADSFVFVSGFKGLDVVRFAELYSVLPFAVVSQGKPIGVGNAILCAKKMLDGEPFMLCWGDHMLRGDLERLDRNTVWYAKVNDPRRFGVLEIKGDRVIGLEEKPEKPKSNCICVGLYYVHDAEKFWHELEKDGDFEASLDRLAKKGKLWCREIDTWVDLGTMEKYVSFCS
jgi:glucose-1-phosphate thymidylyltransferase